MKLLFDQNISFRILNLLNERFQMSLQVRTIGLENATDQEIWNYAKKHDYTIVTFDADFADIAYLKGFPPKVIWLRTGNRTTKEIAEILLKHQAIIIEFIRDEEYNKIACLELE